MNSTNNHNADDDSRSDNGENGTYSNVCHILWVWLKTSGHLFQKQWFQVFLIRVLQGFVLFCMGF